MTYDIVIVGGGLSGLALAAELAAPDFCHLQVLVLEQRTSYQRDRTWSYWQRPLVSTHQYSQLERRVWGSWRVQQDKNMHTHGSLLAGDDIEKTTYRTLDSDAFYSAAQQTIARSSHVKLRLGTSVRQILAGDTPSVETSEGELINAVWIFDARPGRPSKPNYLVQQFFGREITTDRDVFNTETVDLMRFQPSAEGLHFFYVLPYSARNALVETTWISPVSHRPDFEAELKKFTTALVGSATYSVNYEEKGSLNLSQTCGNIGANRYVVPLGRAAGTLRASTGYAFLETLEHAQKIAVSLRNYIGNGTLRNWAPVMFKRSAVDAWMDAVFLRVLRGNWSNSSMYFMQLFEKVEAQTLAAFLSGRANWRQRLLVARALPAWPFIVQALSMAAESAARLMRLRR